MPFLLFPKNQFYQRAPLKRDILISSTKFLNTIFVPVPMNYFCVVCLVRRLFRWFFGIFCLNLINFYLFLGFIAFGFQLQFLSHVKSFTAGHL